MPVEISDWNELADMEFGEDYVLVNDLDEDTAGYDSQVGGREDASWDIDLDLTGEFDGNGHTISDLYTTSISGLFDNPEECLIKDLTLENCHSSTDEEAGLLFVSTNNGYTIDNVTFRHCSVSAEGRSEPAGLIGSVSDAGSTLLEYNNVVAENCRVSSSDGNGNVGAFVGDVESDFQLSGCSVINCDITGSSTVGGTFATTRDGAIEDTIIVNSSITSTQSSARAMGGFIDGVSVERCAVVGCHISGASADTFESSNAEVDYVDCYVSNNRLASTGVDDTDSYGSVHLWTDNREATVQNCYVSSIMVVGDDPVIFDDDSVSSDDFYWDIDTTIMADPDDGFVIDDGDLVPADRAFSTDDLTGQSADETMSEFDFDDVWRTVTSERNGSDSYPILRTIDEELQLRGFRSGAGPSSTLVSGEMLSGSVEIGGSAAENAIVFAAEDGTPPVPKSAAVTDESGEYTVTATEGKTLVGVIYDDGDEKWGRAKSLDFDPE